MPTYEFTCPNGHDFEKFFRTISSGESELPCPLCGAVAARKISAGAGLMFKGSGFYITDYGKDGKKDQNAARKSGSNGDGGSASSDSGTGGGDSSSSGDAKSSSESKSSDSSTSESKSAKSDAKVSDTKASNAKPAAAKPAESKPSAPKSSSTSE